MLARELGFDATAVVVDEEWATPDAQVAVQLEGVEWRVGGGLSRGLLDFCRLQVDQTDEPKPTLLQDISD